MFLRFQCLGLQNPKAVTEGRGGRIVETTQGGRGARRGKRAKEQKEEDEAEGRRTITVNERERKKNQLQPCKHYNHTPTNTLSHLFPRPALFF